MKQPGSVTEYMQTDHQRLDAMLQRLAGELDLGDVPAARSTFEEIACGLVRHMRAEEEILFPAFEEATGMVGGPVRVMHAEHGALRELLGAIRGALASGDVAAARAALGEVVQVLTQHNMKEEHVIYPRTDQALGEREGDALVQRMLAL